MATNENLIPIPGRLHSVASEGHVSGADEIYDDTLQKTQATINQEVSEALGEGGTVDEKIAEAIEDVAYIDDSESSPAVVPSFDPESQTVHVTAQTLSEQQKAQVRDNIGLGDVDAKINEAVASEASQRAAAVSGVQASVSAETSRAQAAESALQNNIEALTKSDIVVVADHTSVSSPDPLTIYREQGTNTYSDWMYQNGSWMKMAEYDNAIDDEPTAGSDNLVKSGGVANLLYEEIKTNIDLSESLVGLYMNVGVGMEKPSITELSGFLTKNLPCTTGQKYIVDSSLGGSSMRQVIFWNISNVCVGIVNVGDSQIHVETITVPETATSMSVSTKSDYTWKVEKLDYLPYDLEQIEQNKEDIATINENLDILSETVGNVVEVKHSKNLFNKSEVINDKVINTDGNLETIAWTYNKTTGLIPVEPNKYYFISGDNMSSAINIRCLASDGVTKMKVLAPASGTEYAANYNMPNADGTDYLGTMNGQFKTPANAAYVQFVVASNDDDNINTAMIELVGDSYNPDFVPSEYEEYYVKDVIKEDALPDGINEKSEKAYLRNNPIKLLLIGSSHGMNTIAQFPWIAYKSGFNVEVGNIYIGSLSLQRLVGIIQRNETISFRLFKNGAWGVKSGKFKDIIKYTDWNFISLQRSATDDELWLTTQKAADEVENPMTDINYQVPGLTPEYMSHTDALQFILNKISENATDHPSILFNTGFADANEGSTDTQKILTSANKMKSEFGIEYVPVATAIKNARNTYLRNFGVYEGHNMCIDSQHLDFGIGCWVASITLLEFILRRLCWDVEVLIKYGSQAELYTFNTDATPSNYTEPTIETMNVARACAKAACNMIDSLSEEIADRFKWQVSYNLPNGVTVDNPKGYSADGDSYKTTISGTVTSVSVTMGGVDITSSAYSGGVVTINSVTGDVVITAI